VNTSPEKDGWFFTLVLDDKSELEGLMNGSAYKAFVDGL
jgi:glycine cleavage system H protein